MEKATLADLAILGATFKVKAVPRAKQNSIRYQDGLFRVTTTTAPEDGRATAAVAEMLAHALGVAKTRLTLLRGAASRDKVFRLD